MSAPAMIRLSDVVEANRVLMALGGEDQMQRIAAASIERSLELQSRLDRALAYAEQTPPNSAHARNMARILDGSITIDDELREVDEERAQALHGQPRRLAVERPKRTRGPNKKKKDAGPGSARSGLTGRTPQQRREFRAWIAEQGYDVPQQGPVPHELVELYDLAMEEARRQRAAQRQAEREKMEAAVEGQLELE